LAGMKMPSILLWEGCMMISILLWEGCLMISILLWEGCLMPSILLGHDKHHAHSMMPSILRWEPASSKGSHGR
jgi:hypothetical protein